jgi:acetyltransferase-like isoleucine patch superfamily enzyme
MLQPIRARARSRPSPRHEKLWSIVHALLRPFPGRRGALLREVAYRPFFAELGLGVVIADGVQIRAPWGISLGEQVAVNFGASLDGTGGLTCGRRALIGPYSVLHTSEHLPPESGDNYGYRFAPVTIGPWAVITAHVVVTAGTTIGEAALVGAGAVVTRDVADREVVAGVPARAIVVQGSGETGR